MGYWSRHIHRRTRHPRYHSLCAGHQGPVPHALPIFWLTVPNVRRALRSIHTIGYKARLASYSVQGESFYGVQLWAFLEGC